MSTLHHYSIAFVGLKNGIHHFEYKIDKKFFSFFPDSVIKDGNVDVKVEFDKKDSFFVLHFSIDGTVNVPCDRCLELFDLEIFNDFDILVKLEEREGKIGDEEDVIYLPKTSSHIELAELIYEFIHVTMPMQIAHKPNTDGSLGCDKEVLKHLSIESETEEKTIVDPRWEALNKLKNKN